MIQRDAISHTPDVLIAPYPRFLLKLRYTLLNTLIMGVDEMQLKLRPLLAFALVLLVPAVSFAATGGNNAVDRALTHCLNSAETHIAITTCYQQATQAWDNELNTAYRQLITQATPEFKDALKQSQRHWIDYRDSYVDALVAYYESRDGAVWQIVLAQSVLNVTKEKALDLQRLYESTPRVP